MDAAPRWIYHVARSGTWTHSLESIQITAPPSHVQYPRKKRNTPRRPLLVPTDAGVSMMSSSSKVKSILKQRGADCPPQMAMNASMESDFCAHHTFSHQGPGLWQADH